MERASCKCHSPGVFLAEFADCTKCGRQFIRKIGAPGRQKVKCDVCARPASESVWSMHCRNCGTAMSGQRRLYCNAACRESHYRSMRVPSADATRIWFHYCLQCNKKFASKWQRKATCSDACAKARNALTSRKRRKLGKYSAVVAQCQTCGCEFAVKHRMGQRYCSRECYAKRRYGMTPQQRRRKYLEQVAANKCKCSACGNIFVLRQSMLPAWLRVNVGAFHLCKACRVAWSGASDHIKSLDKASIRDNGMANCREPIGQCVTCGIAFIRTRHQTQCGACVTESQLDGRWRSKLVRKSRGERQLRPPRRRMVFERDDWTCQLCGISVRPRRHAANEPDEATIDHIVPLAMGGAHTAENMQTACRRCNSLKGDRITAG